MINEYLCYQYLPPLKLYDLFLNVEIDFEIAELNMQDLEEKYCTAKCVEVENYINLFIDKNDEFIKKFKILILI